jgi:hypothetical protein
MRAMAYAILGLGVLFVFTDFTVASVRRFLDSTRSKRQFLTISCCFG